MYYSKYNIFIKDNVLIDLRNYEVYEIDNETLRLINEFNNNIINNIRSDKEIEIYEFLNQKIKKQPAKANMIDTVKINVSNTCNMNCSYCYANKGNYGKKDSIMSIDTAKQVCDFIKDHLKGVKNISFFGGEPLLALDSIKLICEENKDKTFMLQTNGTIINDDIINIINKFNIKTTISLDGNKEINDYHRVFNNGEGSFDVIIENINKLIKKARDNFVAVQGTYTMRSLEKGYTMEDVVKYIYEISKVKFIKVEHVDGNKILSTEADFKKYVEREIDIFYKYLTEHSILIDCDASKFIRRLFSQKYNDYLCEAGNSILTIDAQGEIYPCQMFINNKSFHMGNIKSSIKFEIAESYLKSSEEKCKDCIAKCYCVKCIGIYGEKFNDDWIADCFYKKEIAFQSLSKIVEIIKSNKLEFINRQMLNLVG